MAEQYEYLVVGLAGLPREQVLNSAGRKGWELVSVAGDKAYLKRPIYPGFVLDEDGVWVEEAERPEPPPAPPSRKRRIR